MGKKKEKEPLYTWSNVFGCQNDCRYCWVKPFHEDWQSKGLFPKDATYNMPVYKRGALREALTQLKRQKKKLRGKYLLLCNTSDPLREPAIKDFQEITKAALEYGMNPIVLSKAAPPFAIAMSKGLHRAIINRAVMKEPLRFHWGASITTMSARTAGWLEPGAALPSERTALLNSIHSWAREQEILGKLRTFVSVSWHERTGGLMNMLKTLNNVHVEMVIIELLHKKRCSSLTENQWNELIMKPEQISPAFMLELVEYGAENGMKIVFKDELRAKALHPAGHRPLYEAYCKMHGFEAK